MHNLNMAKEWVKASILDLAVIEEIIGNENLTTMIAFHSQQSIEKNLKAILEYYNQDVPKIHQIKKYNVPRENKKLPKTHELLNIYIQKLKIK